MWPTLFNVPLIGAPVRGYGLMLMIGFLGGTWWAARRAVRTKGDPDFVINLGFVSLISSIVGARLFYVIHYWDKHFAGRSLWSIVDVSAGGLEFYGGLIGALLAGNAYILLTGRSMRYYLDVIAPSIMFGMGMARIGCFLNGCCWGGPCSPELAWGVRFPFGSPVLIRQWEDRQATAPAELVYVGADARAYLLPRDLVGLSPEEFRAQKHENTAFAGVLQRNIEAFHVTQSEIDALAASTSHVSHPVHPVQLYASIDGLLLAWLLNVYFYRRKRFGMVFGVLLLLYPFVRVVEEIIRIDNPHDTAGLTISQFISLVLVLLGVAWVYAIRRMPLRPPNMVPYVPPPAAKPA